MTMQSRTEWIKTITKSDVELAISDIEKNPVPTKRESTKYSLVLPSKKHLPPKLVLMRAYELKTGKRVPYLSGGEMTNSPLRKLGYDIQNRPSL